MNYYVQFEHFAVEAEPLVLGPFPEFIQATYSDLRVGPDGECIAFLDTEEDMLWHITKKYLPENHNKEDYSDFIVFAKKTL